MAYHPLPRFDPSAQYVATRPFLLAGAITAFACLDLELGNGFFHYCMYLAATILLRYVIGMGSLWAMTHSG